MHVFILRKVGTFPIPMGRDDLEKLVEQGGILIRVSFDSFRTLVPVDRSSAHL